ncbi:pullulanase [Jeotgalibacillus malaysiensis]|uniref:pullulanase n=1 Tax=Jeotgalibacillus malaysiensis TaxID=1508404 RepID=A0A0B5AVN8_9BACL|nr:type I pullulanase [Jeotgalibacillus malaysiensis]AJD92663.1 pullulanase [Jeotgalibacillus malaysiensis]
MNRKKFLAGFLSLLLVISLLPIVQPFASNTAQAESNTYSTLIVHYEEAPESTQDWNLWVWPEGGEGQVHEFTGEDEFGKIATVDLEGSHNRIGFIVRTDAWEKDGDDRWAETEAGVAEVWIKSGDDTIYTSPPDGEYREFPEFNKVDVTLHYYRFDGNYEGWNLWAWPGDGDGQEIQFTGEDDFGLTADFTVSSDELFNKVGFIVKKTEGENAWADQENGDRFITKINEDGTAEIWIVQSDKGVYYDTKYIDSTPRIVSATIDEVNEITLTTNLPIDTAADDPGITLNGLTIADIRPFDGTDPVTNKVTIETVEDIDLTQTYTIETDFFGDATVQVGKVVRSESFDDMYFYDGDDLGNTYTEEQTDFRLWAPTASEARLVLYDTWDAAEGKEIVMDAAEKGTWTASVEGDLHNQLYTYKVKIGDEWREAVDPYVRSTSVNGDKGAVLDLDRTNPEDWETFSKGENPEDATIYELHVRDLSIQPESGIENKGKYLGVTEKGTTGPEGYATGLDHILNLGVSHVQFLPIYDYRTVDETNLDTPQFNWGYDPKNYNTPEGSYSTDPYDPEVRVTELKEMIQTLHDEDLGVIMDVVYNHMYAVNESNFHQLVPGYYFRYNEDGSLANGTGVGNDTASERKMMQKFIVDSVSYWAEEYEMDGFRFDLMGIHDTDTMNEVREALDEIDPSIIVLGEGWDLNTPLDAELKANQKNAEDMDRVAHFNDTLRDGAKGSVWEDTDPGFINGKQGMEEIMRQSVAGGIDYDDSFATYRDPDQVVQYVEAHDNLTLWDKLEKTNPDATLEEMKSMHKLGSSIVLTSQGISFIHAGQEFMRTKGGDHNSYQSPDSVNQLDWERRAAFNDEVEYMAGLIDLRQNYDAFRLTNAEAINERLTFAASPANTIAYTLQEKKNRHLFVVHNANKEAVSVSLPGKGPWKVLVNSDEAGTEVLSVEKGKSVEVDGLSSMVLLKNGKMK